MFSSKSHLQKPLQSNTVSTLPKNQLINLTLKNKQAVCNKNNLSESNQFVQRQSAKNVATINKFELMLSIMINHQKSNKLSSNQQYKFN